MLAESRLLYGDLVFTHYEKIPLSSSTLFKGITLPYLLRFQRISNLAMLELPNMKHEPTADSGPRTPRFRGPCKECAGDTPRNRGLARREVR